MKLTKLRDIALHKCHLDQTLPVVVGVSGGPDSLCLLDSLAQTGFPVIAAHFDHQLRLESAEDAAYVHAAADRLNIPFVTGSQDVAGYAGEKHLTIEEAARELRYRFLFAQARAVAAQAVAVGHTADDQVETILMHLLRGSGLSGLTGMDYRVVIPDWDAQIPLVRPLLPFWREETLACCQERGLEPLVDPTNTDTRYFRNRVRKELIPVLESYNPQVRSALWRMARSLSADEAVVESSVDAAWQSALVSQESDFIFLDLSALRKLPEGLQRRVLIRSAEALLPAARDLDFDAIERGLWAVDQPGFSGKVELLQGLVIFREGEHLVVSRVGERIPPDGPLLVGYQEPVLLPAPGSLSLPGGWTFSCEMQIQWPQNPADQPDPWQAWLDADSLPAPLAVRRPTRGDRFQPLGMEGHSIKLSDFWTNQKLPRRARAGWPLVVCGDQIAWIPGFRLAHPFRLNQNTRRALHLRLFRV